MNLETLQINEYTLVEPMYGFALVIREDEINRAVKFQFEGFGSEIKKVLTNPIAVGVATYFGLDAIQAYKKSKRYTTTLFAKSQAEKKIYDRIVLDLMKTGNYKKVKDEYADGGHLYVLEMK